MTDNAGGSGQAHSPTVLVNPDVSYADALRALSDEWEAGEVARLERKVEKQRDQLAGAEAELAEARARQEGNA